MGKRVMKASAETQEAARRLLPWTAALVNVTAALVNLARLLNDWPFS
jgi:hypothetical protein